MVITSLDNEKVKKYRKDKKQQESKEEKIEEKKIPETKVCPYCYSEIKYEATRCPHCTSILEEKNQEILEK